MKRFSLCTLTILAVAALGLVASPQALAAIQPPPGAPAWWDDEHCGFAYMFGRWAEPPGENPPNDADHWHSNWGDHTDYVIDVSGLDVTVTLNNDKIPEAVKKVFIYLEGTGAAPPVVNSLLGENDAPQGPSDFEGKIVPDTSGGNWTLVVHGIFRPQPDRVILSFTMPAGGTLEKAWAGDCCHDTDGTFDDACPDGSRPPCDEVVDSLGSYVIKVDCAWWVPMALDCPPYNPAQPQYGGYDAVRHRLYSGTLEDPVTVLGRSAPHYDGDNFDENRGHEVGAAGTMISDGDFDLVPVGFEGPIGTREVHTELVQLDMVPRYMPNLARLRAGIAMTGEQIPSPGEVESLSGAGGDPDQDFPAESFFDVFVEADLPCGFAPAVVTVYNKSTDPLLVKHDRLTRFPPRVVYRHEQTNGVPVYIRSEDPLDGQLFGWIVLAGHGVAPEDDPWEDDQFNEELVKGRIMGIPGGVACCFGSPGVLCPQDELVDTTHDCCVDRGGTPQVMDERIYLDRPVDEPNSHPQLPLTNPYGQWHELYPKYSIDWQLVKWRDTGGNDEVDSSDYVYMMQKETGVGDWYHVENATATINATEMFCVCAGGTFPGEPCFIDTDCGLGGVCECLDMADAYFDYQGDNPGMSLKDPIGTQWHEVYPDFCRTYNLINWIDTGLDGHVSHCDMIQLMEKKTGVIRVFHVKGVSWDLVIAPEVPERMNLELPGSDPLVDITNPLVTWHELWPKFCSDWRCVQWRDNGNGRLDKSDFLSLKREDTGSGMYYYVVDVTATIKVSEKPDLTEVSYLDYMGDDLAGALYSPGLTQWHEVYPWYSRVYNVVGWIDTDEDGRISASDQIALENKETGKTKEYHVDAVSTDIEVVAQLPQDIPAVTAWGLAVMVLLVLAAGTVVIRRARALKVSA